MSDFKCDYSVRSSGSSSQRIIGGKFQGPDVTGDGASDHLIPQEATITYQGESKEVCHAIFARDYSDNFAANITGASGVFRATIYSLSGVSTQGMQDKPGKSWEEIVSPGPFNFPNIPNLLSLGIDGSFPDFDRIAYSNDIDGESTDSSTSGDTVVEEDGRGGYRVSSRSVFRSSTTSSGKAKRSEIETDDIVDSQLPHALAIPYGGQLVRIGTAVEVMYFKPMPKDVQKIADCDDDDTSFRGRVIGFSGILYEKIGEQYQLMPGSVMVHIAPKGEDDILRHVTLGLSAGADTYFIRVQ